MVYMTNTWPIHTELFAAPHSAAMIDLARRYVSEMKLLPEDVKIVQRGEQVLVIARRDIRERSNDTQQDQAGCV